jgi:hypothetical protein
MKKAILTSLLCLCFSILAFGSLPDDPPQQDIRKPLRVSGKKIYTEDILHTENEVLSLLSISPDFVAQYQKGKSLRKTGSILFVGGIVTFTGGFALMGYGLFTSPTYEFYGTTKYDYNSTYYIGGIIAGIGELMVDGGIICKIVGKSNIRKSIYNYNDAIKSTGYKPGTYYYQVGLLDNGLVGLKINF